MLKAIAYFQGPFENPYEPGRQGATIDESLRGRIVFSKDFPGKDSLIGLEKFSHLWLIYQFHQNPEWKNLVSPPRSPKGSAKIGMYASRTPHRLNGLGLSCVKLESIENDQLVVSHFDLLNNTPIYDIKPYLTYADSFPEATGGWTDELQSDPYQIQFGILAQAQLDFLKAKGLVVLKNFILNQLEYEPLNSDKKRVVAAENMATLSYRTWRIEFKIDLADLQKIEVIRIFSGYSFAELSNSEDPYLDKDLHRQFQSVFYTQV